MFRITRKRAMGAAGVFAACFLSFGAGAASTPPRTIVHTVTLTHTVTRTVKVPVTRVVTRTVTKVVTKTVKVPVVHTVVKTVTVRVPAAAPPTPPTASANATQAQDPDTGVVATASNMRWDSGGDSPPPSGQGYIAVHVLLTNNGTNSASYNALDFKLQGGQDHVMYDADAFDLNISPTLGSGQIAPGQTVAGELVFEVPTTQSSGILLWTPNFLGSSIPVPVS